MPQEKSNTSFLQVAVVKPAEVGYTTKSALLDGWQSGRLRTPGKRVYRKVSGVRIPPHPPAEFLNLRSRQMLKTILGSKIHRAIVTDANVDYEGSMAIDEEFLEEAGIEPYEKILIGNQSNGHRFETYAIKASRGSKSIVLNGAVAHLGKKGDRLTIMAFVQLTAEQLKTHAPKVIVLNDQNEIINRRGI